MCPAAPIWGTPECYGLLFTINYRFELNRFSGFIKLTDKPFIIILSKKGESDVNKHTAWMLRLVFALSVTVLFYACTVNRPFVIEESSSRIIGEVEPVTIREAGMTLPARIDTGATTSSLDAADIVRFERDGRKWVRFTVTDRRTGKKKEVESRLIRNVDIIRHGKEPQKRPVVKLKAVIGDVELFREFSLTDRSDFAYQILIGRNLLEGEFVVDVRRKNVTAPMSEK